MSPPPQEPFEDKPTEWKWETALKEKVGTVQKVVNKNYAVGVSYLSQGWEERRFFVLFDTCDVWINDEVVQKSGKDMKDVINVDDSIKFNAVYVDTDNEWNLTYLATAVIVNKNQAVIRDELMPLKAIMKENCNQLNPSKIQTFKIVAGKITKKPPPVDPNVQARMEEMKKRREMQERRRIERKEREEADRQRIAIEKNREDRIAQKAAEAAEADRQRIAIEKNREDRIAQK